MWRRHDIEDTQPNEQCLIPILVKQSASSWTIRFIVELLGTCPAVCKTYDVCCTMVVSECRHIRDVIPVIPSHTMYTISSPANGKLSLRSTRDMQSELIIDLNIYNEARGPKCVRSRRVRNTIRLLCGAEQVTCRYVSL